MSSLSNQHDSSVPDLSDMAVAVASVSFWICGDFGQGVRTGTNWEGDPLLWWFLLLFFLLHKNEHITEPVKQSSAFDLKS